MNQFQFKVCEKMYPEHKDIIFEAIIEGNRYKVSWKEGLQQSHIYYLKEDVEKIIEEGIWIIIE